MAIYDSSAPKQNSTFNSAQIKKDMIEIMVGIDIVNETVIFIKAVARINRGKMGREPLAKGFTSTTFLVTHSFLRPVLLIKSIKDIHFVASIFCKTAA